MIRDNYPNLDIKALSKQIDKSESKKAMPFINALKRRLDAGEVLHFGGGEDHALSL